MDNYVRTIVDKNSRFINIGGDCDNIVAEYNDQEIGRFDFDFIDDKRILTHCLIDEGFQRCSIGTEMMKLAEDWHDNFDISKHLADEGACFLKKYSFKVNHNYVNYTH